MTRKEIAAAQDGLSTVLLHVQVKEVATLARAFWHHLGATGTGDGADVNIIEGHQVDVTVANVQERLGLS